MRAAGAREERTARQRVFELVREGWKHAIPLLLVLLGLSAWSIVVVDQKPAVFATGFAVASVGWYVAMLVGRHAGTTNLLIGRDGERWTATELSSLGARWNVLHQFPLDYGNVDHIAVGPGGVVVVETKVRTDGWDLHEGVDERLVNAALQARTNARKVRAVMQSVHVQVRREVRPVVVVWGSAIGRSTEVDGVSVVHGSALKEWFAGLADEDWTVDELERVQAGLAHVLATRTDWERSHRPSSMIVEVGPVAMTARVLRGLFGAALTILGVGLTWPLVPLWLITVVPIAFAVACWKVRRVERFSAVAFGGLVAALALATIAASLQLWIAVA